MKTSLTTFLKAGFAVTSLGLFGTACGGEDDGGSRVDRDVARAGLEAIISEGGLPPEVVDCLVEVALDVFDDTDLESLLAGGEPNQEAEKVFNEKAVDCTG